MKANEIKNTTEPPKIMENVTWSPSFERDWTSSSHRDL